MITKQELEAEQQRRKKIKILEEEMARRKLQNASLFDRAVGVGENALNMLGTMATEPVAGLAGMGAAIIPGGKTGAEMVESVQQAGSNMFGPRTEAGQEIARQTGEAFKPIGDALSGGSQWLGDKTLELTGSPVAATAAHTTPAALAELAGLKGLKAVSQGSKQLNTAIAPTRTTLTDFVIPGSFKEKVNAIERINAGDPSPDLAHLEVVKAKLGEGPTIKVDDVSANMIREGFSPGMVQPMKNQNLATLRAMRDMSTIQKKMIQDEMYRVKNRPSDVVGNVFKNRFDSVVQANKQAGKEIDNIAKTILPGKQINLAPIGDGFQQGLESMGIKGIDTGELDFSSSSIRGIPELQKPLNNLYRQMLLEGGNIDALGLHQLKRQIDNTVAYGKNQTGLSGDAERVMKGLRASINEQLKNAVPEYANANKQYAQSIEIIDEVQRISGRQLDLSKDSSAKAIGTLMRRMLGNPQSRIPLIEVVDAVDAFTPSISRGQKMLAGPTMPQADLSVLVRFADELDSNFGAAAKSSLQGDFDKSLANMYKSMENQGEASFGDLFDPVRVAGKLATKVSGSKDPVKLHLAQYNARMKAAKTLDKFLLEQAKKKQKVNK